MGRTINTCTVGWLLLGAVALLPGCGDDTSGPTPSEPSTTTDGMERPDEPRPEAVTPRIQLLEDRCETGDADACLELEQLHPGLGRPAHGDGGG